MCFYTAKYVLHKEKVTKFLETKGTRKRSENYDLIHTEAMIY